MHMTKLKQEVMCTSLLLTNDIHLEDHLVNNKVASDTKHSKMKSYQCEH